MSGSGSAPIVDDNERLGDWMQTYTGKAWYPVDPRPEDVCIEDIAHALSLICRFAGHCKHFYSVAEHSYLVSYMVPQEYALQGLLHDATEAYCVDVPRPLKRYLASYKVIEHHARKAICERFGLDPAEPKIVKQADSDILLSEHARLFQTPPKPWLVENAKKRPEVRLLLFSPAVAEIIFLKRYKELTEGSIYV